MGRKRNELGPEVEERIKALIRRGGTAASIEKLLKNEGVEGISVRTVGRRIREIRGDMKAERARKKKPTSPAPAARSKRSTPPLPTTPEAIPEGADLEMIDQWIQMAQRAAREAEVDGNLAGMGQMGRLTTALLEAKRRATPPDAPDPNDRPDMKALGEQVEARFMKMIDEIAGAS